MNRKYRDIAEASLILRKAHQEVDPIEHPAIAGTVRRAFEHLDDLFYDARPAVPDHNEPCPDDDAEIPCGRPIPDITPKENPFGWYDCDRPASHDGPCGHSDLDARRRAATTAG